MVNTTTPVLKARNTGIVICDDQEATNRRIAPQLAQCQGKGKALCCAKGKEKLTPNNVLQILKERNGGVVIREDQGNGKPPCQAKGKENQTANGSVLSYRAAAQRARREREKMSNILLPSKSALGQQARRQREQNNSNPPAVSKAALAQRKRREREKNARENFPEGSIMLPPTPRLADGFISDRTPLTSMLQNHHKRLRTENLRSIPTPRNLINDFTDNAMVISQTSDGASCSRKRSEPESENAMENFPEGSIMLPPTPRLVDGFISERTPVTSMLQNHHKRLDTENLRSIPTPRDLINDFTDVAPPITEYVRGSTSSHVSVLQDQFPVYEVLGDDDDEDDISCDPPIVNGNDGRHSLGNMDIRCPFCEALHWRAEKLVHSSQSNPHFGTCCLQGKVRLPLLKTPPPVIQSLYDGDDDSSKSFRRYAREYNAANAFTSLGAKLDPRVLMGRGPKSFIIHGELRHRTGTLIPESDHEATYAQLYIYDPDSALELRHRRNPHLRRDVLKSIQDTLQMHNEFPSKFRQAHELLMETEVDGRSLPAYLHYSASTDKRRYNLPTVDEVAVILPGDGTEISGMRDIIVRLRGRNELMRISECHPAYLPLHYVLLFPHGELGWEPEMRLWDVDSARPSNTRLTQMQYYSHRLFQRPTEYSTILRAGKLFQEFLVDAWAATEQNRLTYIRLNQHKLRTELYKDLTDVVIRDEACPNQVGRRMVLPSSHLGSPRHMFEIFQDSMAITRHNNHPDVFLTMTANPKWPEILKALFPHQQPSDRPEIIARVFELKRKALMKIVEERYLFGRKAAHVYTIEYQKRGLPHMHALIYVHKQDKIRTCAQVDKFISAEIPDPDLDPVLFQTVLGCMIHGPCGQRNPHAPCMENGKCTKGYPKEFRDTTTMDERGYPLYHRHDNGKQYTVRGKKVDNRDVVPYNPELSRLFDCHINVEVCAGMSCVKYIHKYIFKGHDRATMIVGVIDEIQQYLEGRYIGPAEAAWRLLGYSLHEEYPAVVRLALHLPGMHHCVFNSTDSLEVIAARVASQKSTLTAFFDFYAANPTFRAYTYAEFPQYFVWRKKEKVWVPRQRGYAIGRMYFASPNSGERFYMRLLLTFVKGPKSFEDLRTVNGVLCPTFKGACVALGLLEDDEEWIQCLQEAAVMKTGYQLRRLFCVLLNECSPLHPYDLWKRFSKDICDDLHHKISTVYGIINPDDSLIEDYGLYLLNEMLQQSGKSLDKFPPMPLPSGNWTVIAGNKLIREHRQLQADAESSDVQGRVDSLNPCQREAYNDILQSVLENKGTTFFLSGGAGTGKTFTYNTVSQKLRSLGHIVITVASSGVAALLLVGGRTAHSTFSIPLDVHDNSVCGFSKQSMQASLFRESKLIIWDEVPMQHKYCVETVDRTLRDIRDSNTPFGGITVVLGGDFRQILPVVQKGVREQIVDASLRRSILWNRVHILKLESNMRLNTSDAQNLDFASFLMKIGGCNDEIAELPTNIHRCRTLNELLRSIYPHLNSEDMVTPTYLTERTILSARNDDVHVINMAALGIFPGERRTYLAADKLTEDDGSDRSITNRYPNEYLNSLDPSGLPPFKLELKVGCPIMLLRNIAPADGLCNGTRLVIVRMASRTLEARILTGDKAGNLVFIPRISLAPSSNEMPFHMTRRQFPVRLAYAMTINKSQGQSVKFVGIDLRNPVFSHGQLYVALSRCTSADRVRVILPADNMYTTTNIVYPEVLL